ncbi:hypothetical protein RFI_07120 [Reticulomyxa filosa]|uniref:RGS domain-containing protein n=1 Tax=Reticulomyxa filosa TaxID=46433 RepID=X6NXK6_RETFI|nr:hypothetical protein RFI_07120 [Reticulomyxa filosa]|eukprot:ETO30002.1 hypothetical protein RFI_07120 [Reticulomyxa filosa]
MTDIFILGTNDLSKKNFILFRIKLIKPNTGKNDYNNFSSNNITTTTFLFTLYNSAYFVGVNFHYAAQDYTPTTYSKMIWNLMDVINVGAWILVWTSSSMRTYGLWLSTAYNMALSNQQWRVYMRGETQSQLQQKLQLRPQSSLPTKTESSTQGLNQTHLSTANLGRPASTDITITTESTSYNSSEQDDRDIPMESMLAMPKCEIAIRGESCRDREEKKIIAIRQYVDNVPGIYFRHGAVTFTVDFGLFIFFYFYFGEKQIYIAWLWFLFEKGKRKINTFFFETSKKKKKYELLWTVLISGFLAISIPAYVLITNFYWKDMHYYYFGWFRWCVELICCMSSLGCTVMIPIRTNNHLGYFDLSIQYPKSLNVYTYSIFSFKTFFKTHLSGKELKQLPLSYSAFQKEQQNRGTSFGRTFQSWIDVVAHCDGFDVFMQFLSQELSTENLLFVTGIQLFACYEYLKEKNTLKTTTDQTQQDGEATNTNSYFTTRINLPKKLCPSYLVRRVYSGESTLDEAMVELYKKYIQRGHAELEINIPYDIALQCHSVLYDQNYSVSPISTNSLATQIIHNKIEAELRIPVTIETKLRCIDNAVREISNLLRDSFIRFERTEVCTWLYRDVCKK